MAKTKTKWAVVTVYIENDGYKPRVHVVGTFPNFQFAKTKARELAEELYEECMQDPVNREAGFTFDDVWCKTGFCSEEGGGVFDNWGFSPVEDMGIDEEIRVVPYEE